MTYDMQIFGAVPGLVNFSVPSDITNGVNKLMHRVIILLFSDDGELINYIKGSANTQSLKEEILTRETARVVETLNSNTDSDAPDDEVIQTLTLALLEGKGSHVTLDISVTSESQDSQSILINL
jgi:hypothetical protein